MANNSLYEICRLCMAVLDRDAIDCSKQENSELRENIEMIYNVKVRKKKMAFDFDGDVDERLLLN